MPDSRDENVIPIRPGMVSAGQRLAEDEAYYQGVVRLLLAVGRGPPGDGNESGRPTGEAPPPGREE